MKYNNRLEITKQTPAMLQLSRENEIHLFCNSIGYPHSAFQFLYSVVHCSVLENALAERVWTQILYKIQSTIY